MPPMSNTRPRMAKIGIVISPNESESNRPTAIVANPAEHTNGQYEGDGKWITDGVVSCGAVWTTVCAVSVEWAGPPASGVGSIGSRCRRSGCFIPHQASREWTVGMRAKLYVGGGDEIDHSSVAPSQGSSDA